MPRVYQRIPAGANGEIIALACLFIVDVWGFDPLFRIASFFCLGVGLLALSFVYNRFAETLRGWL